MLVLTRGMEEAVVLSINGEAICRISVVGFKGGPEARLGFEAPTTVQIDRDEIWRKKQAGETFADREQRRKDRIAKLRKQADELEAG